MVKPRILPTGLVRPRPSAVLGDGSDGAIVRKQRTCAVARPIIGVGSEGSTGSAREFDAPERKRRTRFIKEGGRAHTPPWLPHNEMQRRNLKKPGGAVIV